MVKHERVAENVFFFQSDVYAQVNAGVVVSPDMAVVIDTLAFPEETIIMRDFIQQELQIPVRYLINTHYHADHTWGNYLFPTAKIISHRLCKKLLSEKGESSLEVAKKQSNIFKSTKIVYPDLTFESGEMGLQVGKKSLNIFPFPGHTVDSIAVIIKEDRVMFSGDTIMPIPYIIDGSIDDTIVSLKKVPKLGLENIVQGHGDIILRGEINDTVSKNIEYLYEIRRWVKKAARRKYPLDLIEELDVEHTGKSRVLLGGAARELHLQNMIGLYIQLFGETPGGSEEYFEE